MYVYIYFDIGSQSAAQPSLELCVAQASFEPTAVLLLQPLLNVGIAGSNHHV